MLPYRVQVVLGVQLRCVASCFTFNQEKGEGGRKEGRDVADDGRGGVVTERERQTGRPADLRTDLSRVLMSVFKGQESVMTGTTD